MPVLRGISRECVSTKKSPADVIDEAGQFFGSGFSSSGSTANEVQSTVLCSLQLEGESIVAIESQASNKLLVVV